MGAAQSSSNDDSANLSWLPLELRQQIAVEVVGRKGPFPEYFKGLDRQARIDARNCCLVSQEFKQLVQPILFHHAWLQLNMPAPQEKSKAPQVTAEVKPEPKIKVEERELRKRKDPKVKAESSKVKVGPQVKVEPEVESKPQVKMEEGEVGKRKQQEEKPSKPARTGQADALINFPHLREHVRVLVINGALIQGNPPFDLLRDIVLGFLELVPNLESLKLTFFAFPTFPLLTGWLPLAKAPALSRLTSLYIDPRLKIGGGVSRRYAAALTGLEHRVKELVIDASIDVGWMSSLARPKGKHLPALEHLELSAEAVPGLEHLGRASTETLRTLRISSDHGAWNLRPSFSFAWFSELRDLTMVESVPTDLERTVGELKNLEHLHYFTLVNCNPKSSTQLHLHRLPSSIREIKLNTQILSAEIVELLNSVKFDKAKISWAGQRAWSEDEEEAVDEAVGRRMARIEGGEWASWATAMECD